MSTRGSRGTAALVYNGQMWVLGGSDSAGSAKNDVWCSTNGVDWNAATDAALWSTRADFVALAHSGRMWTLGGGKNDVWFSTNGADWTQLAPTPVATSPVWWSSRSGFAALAYGEQIWVLGGFGNDVWSGPASNAVPILMGNYYLYRRQ